MPIISDRFYALMTRVTLISVFLLILVGGLVRSTQAGMGCPDWPRCFGHWIPPMHESELPADYHVRYAAHGYAMTSFDWVKTWTEYVNRLLGVAIGGFIFLTFIASLAYRKTRPAVVAWSGLAFILVGLQGWLGAKVVFSNLHPGIITLHMGLTLFLLISLLTAQHLTSPAPRNVTMPTGYYPLILFSVFLTLVQMMLGIQVRQLIDPLLASGLCRCQWLGHLGIPLGLHRSFSWGLLFFTLFVMWAMRHVRHARQLLVAWSALLGVEAVLGLTLVYFQFPFWAEPLHLVVAFGIFSIQWRLLLMFRPKIK